MLESIRLRPSELDRHLECAQSPDYWRALVPDLSVGANAPERAAEQAVITPAELDEMAARFAEEGLVHTAPLIDEPLAAAMRAGVVALTRADWPPVFAWIYDEFWQVPRSPSLIALFGRLLGPGYRQTPHIWTHLVAGRRGSAGWRPHVDHQGAGMRLTVWIALSDATLDSGCMCVIPRHLMPAHLAGRWHDLAAIERRDVLDLLHASRPLPVRAGSVLAWDASLVHWGSARQSSGEPRISFSMEFAAPDADLPGVPFSIAGDDAAARPDYETRLAIIARAIGLYQHGEPRAVRYAELGERLTERYSRG